MQFTWVSKSVVILPSLLTSSRTVSSLQCSAPRPLLQPSTTPTAPPAVPGCRGPRVGCLPLRPLEQSCVSRPLLPACCSPRCPLYTRRGKTGFSGPNPAWVVFTRRPHTSHLAATWVISGIEIFSRLPVNEMCSWQRLVYHCYKLSLILCESLYKESDQSVESCSTCTSIRCTTDLVRHTAPAAFALAQSLTKGDFFGNHLDICCVTLRARGP